MRMPQPLTVTCLMQYHPLHWDRHFGAFRAARSAYSPSSADCGQRSDAICRPLCVDVGEDPTGGDGSDD